MLMLIPCLFLPLYYWNIFFLSLAKLRLIFFKWTFSVPSCPLDNFPSLLEIFCLSAPNMVSKNRKWYCVSLKRMCLCHSYWTVDYTTYSLWVLFFLKVLTLQIFGSRTMLQEDGCSRAALASQRQGATVADWGYSVKNMQLHTLNLFSCSIRDSTWP